jgi:hypothetical protein
MAIQNIRSSTANKRPVAGALSDGQIAINTNATSTGLFFKDASGSLVKVGPAHVGTSAPNSSPAGSSGNGLGEIWLDTSGGSYTIKIWDGSAWANQSSLTSADIGVTVQGYDANTALTNAPQTFTAEQTFVELKETVYTLATSGSIDLDPANGSIQSSVLTGAATFGDFLEEGQTIVLSLEDGATYTVTWPTITWVTSGGNVAPTLTAKDTLVFWKISTTLYGAYVGSYV